MIIITSACVILCTSIAHLNYYYSSLSYFQKIGSKADDVNIHDPYCQAVSKIDEPEKYLEFIKNDIYGQIRKQPAVDKIYDIVDVPFVEYNNNDNIDATFANIDTYDVFNLPLADGCWFSSTEQTSEYPNAVVCGSAFVNVKVGSDIEILYSSYPSEKKPYKIHVIGKVAPPYHTITLGCTSYNDAMMVRNEIFFLNNELSYNIFGDAMMGSQICPPSAIVKYKDSATEEDIEKCREFYNSFFDEFNLEYQYKLYTPCEILINDGLSEINYYIKTTVTKDLVFIGVASFMFIIMTVIMVKNKLREYYIYYFCGCSKKKTFLISIAAILSIAVVAGIICSAYMMISSYMVANGTAMYAASEYIFSGNCYVIMWAYLLLNVLISCIIPFVILVRKKMTLITLYHQK